MRYLHELPGFAAALANSDVPPPMPEFIAARAAHRRIFNATMAAHAMDAPVVPQARGMSDSDAHGSKADFDDGQCSGSRLWISLVIVPRSVSGASAPFSG